MSNKLIEDHIRSLRGVLHYRLPDCIGRQMREKIKELEETKDTDRPQIKDFFPLNTSPSDINKIFLENHELYNYIQALDNYIDELEDKLVVSITETFSWIDKSKAVEGNLYILLFDADSFHKNPYVSMESIFRFESGNFWRNDVLVERTVLKCFPFPE